jgi:hypothetical protein
MTEQTGTSAGPQESAAPAGRRPVPAGQRMGKHITLLGVFHIVYHALGLIVGIGIFALLSSIGCASGDPDAAVILPIIGSFIGGLFILLSAPGVIAGIWLIQRRGWARVLTMIVGGLGLLDIPLGTALGVYTFWVLMQDDCVELFD